ncbi:MAG: hypothetical protein H6558_18360 [Lewinellaceae bacterium]|nr:hypothetical protein [Lewinellaceae bacterium]
MKFDFSYYNYNGEEFEEVEYTAFHLEEEQIASITKYLEEGGHNVIFLKVRPGYLNQHTFYKRLVAFFHNIEKQNESPYPFSTPIITISELDIFNLKNNEIGEGFQIAPHFRFLDSSIWYRYVPLNKEFSERLEKALRTIGWAYRYNLYAKNVCKEYLEFSNRLLNNSYLAEFGGHASDVFPFKFHLESLMEERAAGIQKRLSGYNLQWNFLLIDDFAEFALREGNNKDTSPVKNEEKCKLKIIEGLINFPLEEQEELSPISADICPQASVSKAIKHYFSNSDQKIVYDIILLDYLFSEPKSSIHYGTELLEQIADPNNKVKEGKGVFQSYWIHPVSVFSEAMLSDFQEKSLQHFEKDWQLARGADPINTPHLFRCSLYEFMDVQFRKIFFTEEDLWSFLADNPIRGSQLTGRRQANLVFRRFIERFSTIEGLPEGSRLAQTIKALMHKPSKKADGKPERSQAKSLMENIRQLLYLLAFTTGFDFPILEREFMTIDKRFRRFRRQKEIEIAALRQSPEEKTKKTEEEREKIDREVKKIRQLLKRVEKQMERLSMAVYRTDQNYEP